MEQIISDFFSSTGPLGMGWLLAAWLLWRKSKDDEANRGVISKNTEAFVHLRTIFEERLPRGGR